MVDHIVKPDLVAPGSKIVSAAAKGSTLVNMFPDRFVDGPGARDYFSMSGTSMSAAVVSGAVALLLDGRDRADAAASEDRAAGERGLHAGVRACSRLARDGWTLKTLIEITNLALANTDHRPASRCRFRSREAPKSQVIVWGDVIVWGNSASSGVESHRLGQLDVIIWGNDVIIWGNSADVIMWGKSTQDVIVWGNSAARRHRLGQLRRHLGQHADVIVWGEFGRRRHRLGQLRGRRHRLG